MWHTKIHRVTAELGDDAHLRYKHRKQPVLTGDSEKIWENSLSRKALAAVLEALWFPAGFVIKGLLADALAAGNSWTGAGARTAAPGGEGHLTIAGAESGRFENRG